MCFCIVVGSTGDGRFTSDNDSGTPLASSGAAWVHRHWPRNKRSSIISSSSHWSFNPGPSFLHTNWALERPLNRHAIRDNHTPQKPSRYVKRQNQNSRRSEMQIKDMYIS